ncbi:aminotransferase class I/II-fold pyridoxal phosphate-dependent enzyme [Granulicella sp. 5B5]|uniref:threonine aldolase family protein n=1 Tax=Granulicella sp. 5B5 TaxID=1617967 RepID=UPI0015F5570C|nr:GntG family PLP-dependent aldolase [Granulicella sp. 5B5]QMV17850.1 aminotransferase class I/II-fold pyridoxal phosphate-dependent enzyme [Granulicella sp. 5B5]
MIDLRSDTVTKPTAAMRAAMASAEVGDDVYGEDPTVNRLEQRAAEIFGKEAAIFVPTGSMGNTIASRLHTEHGQEVICEAQAHILDWEMAMVSAFSGCAPRTVAGERGVLTWQKIKPLISPKIYYRAQTGLIWLENTHNIAGGIVTPLPVLEEIWAGAKEAGLPVHLDGARVFNAASALSLPVAELTRGFDTVMFCLSKGLGAPVGSMLVGAKKHIDRARVFRKALGGGMRQAGVLAAAGLIALEEMPWRLHEDHANARLLAEAVAQCDEAEIDLGMVQTNIVIFKLKGGDASELVAALKREGVLASAIGPQTVRLVTHFDVSSEDCERAAEVLTQALRAVVV